MGNPELTDAIVGCLLGGAVGDAIGLPAEGLSKWRTNHLFSRIDRHRFFLGKGMTSDDTEHACMTAQALIISGGDKHGFLQSLSWQLRLWLLGIPSGAGLATLKATLRLWRGLGPDRSGVFSAGNGPAMRSAILGVCHGHDPRKLRELVTASTRITHTDLKADYGALAVALAAHIAAVNRGWTSPREYLGVLESALGNDADALLLLDLAGKAAASAAAQESTPLFATKLGLGGRGVTGFVYHTVPVVLQAWFRYQTDYHSAIAEIVRCGGDTDTTAAILGGIIGAGIGKAAIPKDWLRGLMEWPRSVRWMERLGARLADVTTDGKPRKPLPLFFPALLPRNILFLLIMLSHRFRRLLPPFG